jgi:hypothetical protein
VEDDSLFGSNFSPPPPPESEAQAPLLTNNMTEGKETSLLDFEKFFYYF